MSKRGPEELLSSIHGAVLAPVMTVDSEPKKAKLDPTALYSQYITQMNGLATAQLLTGQPLAQIAAPAHCTASSSAPRSRVVHIRNIPPDMVDVELIQLCVPYGPLSNYMMLKGKSQAFIEYEDEHSAVGFVTSMNAVPIQIRGRTIFAQYSTHQELKLDKTRSLQDVGSNAPATLNLAVPRIQNGSWTNLNRYHPFLGSQSISTSQEVRMLTTVDLIHRRSNEAETV
ncbi:hypothetical protein KIN20_010208 [Parelaphostrongylus tenuis]|uniref:RRM domain-containing protein n=1 Tax=Parelaphostrongylus tenuis TaxID=148309 RepID=A0AAD5QL97_PARTN|nr:hypothetical protein KIN20_010208 [Parelaphostrongylus tenuis]